MQQIKGAECDADFQSLLLEFFNFVEYHRNFNFINVAFTGSLIDTI
jgi:hypothetical protein